uniref:NADH-ubiquinone oxidoreductase chain 1 n=1 Tax=Metastrongylus pudendotectus TaxID=55275 RepID=D3J836_METPU|nr:NADH dehydrogenase subunit 1 [Metastrongylus pudendotectus]ACX85135.1 NADH dehydrogenase subunit 1 [Metastrongylus pudendotectus]
MVVLVLVFVLQSIAFITLYERHLLGGVIYWVWASFIGYERHLLGSSQIRLGPNKVSFMGLLQALLDGLKLLKKEQILPIYSSELIFLLVPGVSFLVMILEWFLLPFFFDFLSFEYSLLFFLCLLGFVVYSLMISGFISKSKYGMIGALRASSQSVSYEIIFSIFLLSVMMYLGVFVFVKGFLILMIFMWLPFLIMIVAELNRAPFDFSEGESELVSGYNVEFGSVSFVLLFLSEYGSLIFFCLLLSVFFFDFSLLMVFLIFSLLIFLRSSYPRYRYDLLMSMFWFKFLPISLVYFFFFIFWLYFNYF